MDGLTTIQSKFGPQDTMNRLEAELKARGMTVFARINHAASADQAGLALRATEVILFGNPGGGTPLMQVNQTIGIDLPLKALVWGTQPARPGFRITSLHGWPRGTTFLRPKLPSRQ